MKTVQYFSDERLEKDKQLSPTQIAQFLEDFRQSHVENEVTKILISMRIEESLLNEFKKKCEHEGINMYQKKIRQLMKEWI